MVSRGAGVFAEERPNLAKSHCPLGNVDPGTGVVSACRFAVFAQLEKAPQHVYTVWIFIFHFKLLPFLAIKRGAISCLRDSLFSVWSGGAGRTAQNHWNIGDDYGAFADLVLLSLFMLGPGYVRKRLKFSL